VDAATGKKLVGGAEDAFASALPRLRTSGGGCDHPQKVSTGQNCLFGTTNNDLVFK
jgi:hypothetical protein